MPLDLLVVDDDTSLCEALELGLTLRGFNVRTAANGAEGLAEIRRARPDLVVTDLEMPVMNGRQMLHALSQEPAAKGLPVLIVSSFGFEWEAELMGACGYVRKPVSLDALEAKIREVLGGPPQGEPVH